MDSYGVGPRDWDVHEQEETSILRPVEAAPNPIEDEWTDEKHSLYLKSMEATFVSQLNESLNLFGRGAQKNGQSGAKPTKHKFKVLRDGRWSKTDYREGEVEESQDESRDISENPWIQHYRCSERRTNRKIRTSCAKDHLPTTTSHENQDSVFNFSLWRRDFVGTNAEVTDQNFNVEGLEEDKSDMGHGTKRTRTSIGNRAPTNNQVSLLSLERTMSPKNRGKPDIRTCFQPFVSNADGADYGINSYSSG